MPDSLYSMPETPKVDITVPHALPGVLWTEDDLQVAEHLARARILTFGGREAYGDQDLVEAHTRGVLGEMTVREVLDLPQVEVTYLGGDPGHDLILRDYKADVKTRTAPGPYPDLLVNADRELRADLYIMVHRENELLYRVYGYASQEQVLDADVKRMPNGGGKAHVVEASELYQLPTDDIG